MMTTAAGRLLVLVATAVMSASVAQSQLSYVDVLELYRTGHEQAALTGLSTLQSKDVTRGREALLRVYDGRQPGDLQHVTKLMQTAALLHADRAVASHAKEDVADWKLHIDVARVYVERLASDRRSMFPRVWWLFVIAELQGQVAVSEARQFCTQARASVGDSPELQLAAGVTDEMGWMVHLEPETASTTGDLAHAERAYRNALSTRPDFTEAQLHLGRVLGLSREGQGVKLLEAIGGDSDIGFQYLARLFEGDAFERAGDLQQAEARYGAAIALFPHGQAAYLARAHVRHARGARTEGAGDVRVTTADRDAGDTAEPWFWYARGTAWHASFYFEYLRGVVRQ